jgi:hypothetical protein
MANQDGLLSKGQRDYLNGQKEPNNANHERTIKNRLKNRIRGGINDFALLQLTMESDVREELFESDLETRLPKGNPDEAGKFEVSITRTMALLFHGLIAVYPLSYIETLVEQALKYAEIDRQRTTGTRSVSRYKVTIEEIEIPPIEEAISQLENGEVTAAAIESLLQHDLIDPIELTNSDGVDEILEIAREE